MPVLNLAKDEEENEDEDKGAKALKTWQKRAKGVWSSCRYYVGISWPKTNEPER